MEEEKTTLTQADIVAATLNTPEVTDTEVDLGGRVFKVLYLGYDDHITFISKLTPLFQAFVDGFNSHSLTPLTLIQFLGNDLPALGQIVCRQTDPAITVDEVKNLAGSPFKLAALVFKQIEKNKTIEEVASFFAQIAPILRAFRTK